MPLILPGNVASATASTTFSVANSCRFNDGDTASMAKSNGGSGNQRTYTMSAWVKFGLTPPASRLFSIGDDASNTIMSVFFTSGDLRFEDVQSGNQTLDFRTDAIYRDPSAWQHFAIMVDTTQGTDTNRVKIYHNGTQVTSFSTETYPSENLDTLMNHTTGDMTIGARAATPSGSYFDGYLAEVVVLDGTAAAITDLGEFDEDSPTIWKPKDVSGLTFGTNGFYLDFEDSANLGNDANGGTDFTETNLDATDQATDTPTNNFCTGNPLANFYNQTTFSEGNCKATLASSPYGYDIGTMGVANGKWYWEIKYTSGSGDPHNVGGFGISGKGESLTASAWLGYQSGSSSTDYGYMDEGGTGVLYTNVSGADTDASRSFAIGNIIGIAIDLDSGTHTMTLYVNGNATTTDNISSSPTSGFYFPAWSYGYASGGAVFELNFGGCPAYAITSSNADDNGYGNFEYDVPSGYYALCTKNLAEYG